MTDQSTQQIDFNLLAKRAAALKRAQERMEQGQKTNKTDASSQIPLLLEAERRGILPADKAPLLAEARKRGLVPDKRADTTQTQPEIDFDGLAKAAAAQAGSQGDRLTAGLAELSHMSQNPTVQLPRENSLLGGVLPSPRQAVRNFKENIFGDSDPTTMNRGEALAASLNKAGEAMTLGLIGDEAAGKFDELIGRGNAEERTQFYRDQEHQLREQHPGKAITAEITGALLGPGKGAAKFVNAGRGTGSRILRGGSAGGASGAVYGAAEGEETDTRASGAALGGILGFVGGGTITGAGEGFVRAAGRLKGTAAGQGVIHSLESLRQTADDLFRKVDESGASVPRDAVAGLAAKTRERLFAEGFHPDLHKNVGVIIKALDDASTQPQTLRAMEQLRRVAGSIGRSTTEPDAGRLAGIAMKQIDEVIDSLSSAPKEARQVWGQMRRLQSIEKLIEDAADMPNFEQALQTKFRAFLRNRNNLRGFDDAEIAAIRAVAKGGPLQRSLAALGKALSPASLTGLVASGGTAYAAGPTSGLALAGLGAGSSAVVRALTRQSANKARDLVGSDPARRQIIEALLKRSNPATGATVVPGLFGAQQ